MGIILLLIHECGIGRSNFLRAFGIDAIGNCLKPLVFARKIHTFINSIIEHVVEFDAG